MVAAMRFLGSGGQSAPPCSVTWGFSTPCHLSALPPPPPPCRSIKSYSDPVSHAILRPHPTPLQISEELLRPGFRKSSSFGATGGRPGGGGAPGSSSSSGGTKNPLLLFPVVLHLITSPCFRATTVTPQLIVDLAEYLAATTTGATGAGAVQQAAAVADFKASLLHVLEAICQVGVGGVARGSIMKGTADWSYLGKCN